MLRIAGLVEIYLLLLLSITVLYLLNIISTYVNLIFIYLNIQNILLDMEQTTNLFNQGFSYSQLYLKLVHVDLQYILLTFRNLVFI